MKMKFLKTLFALSILLTTIPDSNAGVFQKLKGAFEGAAGKISAAVANEVSVVIKNNLQGRDLKLAFGAGDSTIRGIKALLGEQPNATIPSGSQKTFNFSKKDFMGQDKISIIGSVPKGATWSTFTVSPNDIGKQRVVEYYWGGALIGIRKKIKK